MVYAGNKTISAFEIKSYDAFYGVLGYVVEQIHGYTESGKKNTSYVANILVFWEISESKEIYVYVLLVEHNKKFHWCKDELKKLYNNNRDQFKKYNGTISKTWSINNNIALKMTSRVRNIKENFEINISISEEKDNHAMRPLCVDIER
jgi:hypothetical protein